MTNASSSRAAKLAHLRRARLSVGDPIPLPLTMAAIFHAPGDATGFNQYGRFSNPTWDAVEEMLGHLEDAPCVAFPSGMGAISAVFFALLKSGDRILLPSDGYHTTRILADRFLGAFGVACDVRPTSSFLDGGFDGYRLVFVESPSNPALDICDIAAVAAAVHKAGGQLVVDNTTMTPFGQRPLDLGADIVVAADTKAPNGHSDVLFGHVASRNAEIVTAVAEWRQNAGGIPGPFEAWLVHRGLETLELRFDRMCSSAEVIAQRLKQHSAVSGLRYPGLADDPSHNLARAQMERFGFLISFDLGSEERAEDFINGCELIHAATSFGGVHTVAERRLRRGDAVTPGFVRLSVGCEPVEELWAAIEASLDRIGG
ncbi:cystathionine gamma-lyase [Aminobacter niigataensis]|uniref:Cystathionine gamma-lyase n=1 Tax=Aminobacter niigataensis TaxID=83265 RepID=A0ABR6KVY8_9HYPH|nr:cystathionine gamma-lyase [Aminobacter niigataensis]MBB4648694.1 cystathionine gamma-lyase [Aminobacter niigataensis]